jgi:RNA 2',3'-cyclic 3'-phosphodiesterase
VPARRLTGGVARLFIAVWPPDEVVARLTALPRKDQRGVRFVAPENWHVTLRFLGEADPGAVLEALSGASFALATAVVGPAVDVLGERALVLPVGGLDDVAATVVGRTKGIGELPPRRRFAGHLTVARLKRHARMPPALGVPFSTAFDVEEVALVESRLDPRGARYETLHTWPLP